MGPGYGSVLGTFTFFLLGTQKSPWKTWESNGVIFVCLFLSLVAVGLYSLSWSGTHYVDQSGLKFILTHHPLQGIKGVHHHTLLSTVKSMDTCENRNSEIAQHPRGSEDLYIF